VHQDRVPIPPNHPTNVSLCPPPLFSSFDSACFYTRRSGSTIPGPGKIRNPFTLFRACEGAAASRFRCPRVPKGRDLKSEEGGLLSQSASFPPPSKRRIMIASSPSRIANRPFSCQFPLGQIPPVAVLGEFLGCSPKENPVSFFFSEGTAVKCLEGTLLF